MTLPASGYLRTEAQAYEWCRVYHVQVNKLTYGSQRPSFRWRLSYDGVCVEARTLCLAIARLQFLHPRERDLRWQRAQWQELDRRADEDEGLDLTESPIDAFTYMDSLLRA